ncbi:MAG: SDR family oxidoreductase [Rhizomicrobium sp.]|nr:SDR family oxidoreductase [Rhizomicrobium sp.]
MNVLFIGGTGIISTACTALAAERGMALTVLRRGEHAVDLPPTVRTLTADIADEAAVTAALMDQHFDAVVDFVAYTPEHIERDIRLFRGRTEQYVFISSASAYQKPLSHYRITESTPLANPYWQYSRDKIACEERLLAAYREDGFPITIVRPSLTYGDTQIPLAINSWLKPYTAIDRLRRGKKLIVPGDGTSLWVCTHNSDFAVGLIGLLGHAQAIGHAFHITSDEVLTWDQITHLTAKAAGVEAQVIHIPADFIGACIPEEACGLTGDKSASVVFDNSKIKSYVPQYGARVPFAEGIHRTIAWFDADPSRQIIDDDANRTWDKLITAYEAGLDAAIRQFRA